MLENNFGAVIPPHINSFQGSYFAQPQAAVMKGKVVKKKKGNGTPFNTWSEYRENDRKHPWSHAQQQRAEREAGMASHEHPPAQLCSLNAAGSVLHKNTTSVGRSHLLHSTILRCSAESVPSLPRVFKRESNKKNHPQNSQNLALNHNIIKK